MESVNKAFRTFILDQADSTVDHGASRELFAPTVRDAAVLALRLSEPHVRGRIRNADGVSVAVWDDSCPKHANGCPICVAVLVLKAS